MLQENCMYQKGTHSWSIPLVHCIGPECARETQSSKKAACTVSDKLVICFHACKTLPVSQFTEDWRSGSLQPQCLGCLGSHHRSHQIQGSPLCWDSNSQKAFAAEPGPDPRSSVLLKRTEERGSGPGSAAECYSCVCGRDMQEKH